MNNIQIHWEIANQWPMNIEECGFHMGSKEFNIVVGINNDFIYVLDTYCNRVQCFNRNGKFIHKWGSAGKKNGAFLQATITSSTFMESI